MSKKVPRRIVYVQHASAEGLHNRTVPCLHNPHVMLHQFKGQLHRTQSYHENATADFRVFQ